jgi:hypothetical protein
MLFVRHACPFCMSMEHVHASCPVHSVHVSKLHVHAPCLNRMFILQFHSVCPCFLPMLIVHDARRNCMSMLHFQAHVYAPCPLCISSACQLHNHISYISMLHVHEHIHAACLCCMSVLHVCPHVHAPCSMLHAPCPMSISLLHVHSACPCCLSILHVQESCMSMVHIHAGCQ